MTSRKRNYCFTINNPTGEDQNNLKALSDHPKVQYLIVGREVGKEGTSHLQCYVYFRNAVVFNAVKKLIPRAHIEVCKGSPEQNITYCSKEGDYATYGEPPVSLKRCAERGKEYWDNIKKKAKTGDIDELDSDIFIRYYRTLRLIGKDYMLPVNDAEETTGIWYWGPSGTGKSRTARANYPDAYLKMCNKWWDGYQRQPFVLIEDFDKKHGEHLGHHMKLWADRYSFLAESKGSAHQIRPEKIIVTSNYHPSDIWVNDPQTLEPILRRFKITQFNNTLAQPS